MDKFIEEFHKWTGKLAEVISHFAIQILTFCREYWVYFVAALALVAVVEILRAYRRWHRGWLSGLIDAKLHEIQIKRRRDWFASARHFTVRNLFWTCRSFLFRWVQNIQAYSWLVPRQLQDFYFPSLTSFFFIAIILILFFVGPHYADLPQFKISTFFDALENEDTAKKVFEGLIVIAVALIIFVAESIRDSKNPERKRALLRISYLWPLTLSVTLFPLGYLAGKLTGVILILLLLMAFFAIFAFSRILRNLLDADASERDLRALLKDRIHSLIMASARERLGNNILSQKIGIDKEIRIEYKPSLAWVDKGTERYVTINHAQSGWLTDINFGDLRGIIELLESEAKKYERAASAVGATPHSTQSSQDNAQKAPSIKVYLLKKFGEQLQQESPFSETGQTILAIRKDLATDSRLIAEIRKRASQAFRVTSADPPSVGFRREMKGTKDQLISAIRSISTGTVEDLRRTYLEVAEEFLETLHQLGGGYSAEQSRKERSNFFEGWNEVRWLVQDVRELLTVSASTDNIDIIGDIAFLPFAIATRAVVARDHLLFEEFTPFASFIYSLAAPKPRESAARAYMADRSWRYLKELCEYYVLPINLEIGGRQIDVTEAQDFALFALKVFQDLLKAAFDNNDIEVFKTVLVEVKRLFRHFNPQQEYPSVKFLKAMIAQTKDEQEKKTLQTQLTEQEKKETASERIHSAQQEIIFGLAGHILDKRANEGVGAKNKIFYEAIEPFLPDNMAQLTRVYEKVSGFRSSDYFDWTRWDSIADGEAHFVDTNTKPDRLFSVLALKLLAKGKPETLAQEELPQSEAIRSLLLRVNEQGIPKSLDSIILNQSHDPILSHDELAQIERFRTFLQKAKEATDRIEEDQLILASLDPAKVEAFTTKVVETRRENGRLRPLMLKLGALTTELSDKSGAKVPSWGFNQLDEKGAFVSSYRVSYSGWGENYGQGLAQAEDKFGFEAFIQGAGTKLTADKETLFKTIEKAIKDAKLETPVVVHSLLTQLEFAYLKQSEIFIPRYRQDCPKTAVSDISGFSGVLRLSGYIVPVISLFIPDKNIKGKLLVADLPRFAHYKEFLPVDDAGDEQHVHDSIFIRIRDLSSDNEFREQIIRDDPEYLRKESDKERYLRTRVVVNVFEKFKIEIIDSSAGIIIEVPDFDE